MSERFTVHAHTNLVDGKSSAREMIESAIARGMRAIGFTEHAHQSVDAEYGMTPEAEKGYIADINALKSEYADRIIVRLGLERDGYSDSDRRRYEYILGALHYIMDEKLGAVGVDGDLNRLLRLKEESYHGDAIAMAGAYYRSLGGYIRDYRPDVIAHFDLITKYNKDGSMIDEASNMYRKHALEALEESFQGCSILEINTGAISRGWRTTPYPAPFLLNAWREMGGQVTIGTDSHHASTVDAFFDLAVEAAKAAGFRSLIALSDRSLFEPREL